MGRVMGHFPHHAVGSGVPVALLSPCPPCQAEPRCNASRQRLARPRLKALPSEYFMGSRGPGARVLPRAFAQIYRKKNKRRESFWPGAAHRPSRSCGGLTACLVARKTGARPGEPGGMGARLQLVEGLTGLAVRGTLWHPPTAPPPSVFHQGWGW